MEGLIDVDEGETAESTLRFHQESDAQLAQIQTFNPITLVRLLYIFHLQGMKKHF